MAEGEVYEEALKSVIGEASRLGMVAAIVYGSYCEGRHRPMMSDIDLLVIARNLPGIKDRPRLLAEIARRRPAAALVDLKLMTPDELSTHVRRRAGWVLDAVIYGRILYDPDGLLASTRKRLMEDLRRMGVRRVPGLGWVWPATVRQSVEM